MNTSSKMTQPEPNGEIMGGPEDEIQSIIDHPSVEPSPQSLKTLFHRISSQNPSLRAKAFSALAITLQYHQTNALLLFQVPLESLLNSTIVQEVCDGLAGLSTLFMLSPENALGMIRSDGFLSRLAESVVDLLGLDHSKSKSKADLNHAFSEFIALSLNHKPVREIIKSDWPGCLEWLTRISLATSLTVSIPARCAASLALIKLRLTSDLQDKNITLPSLTQLTQIMLNALFDNTCPPNSPIEGLALLSQHGTVREILMKESEKLLKSTKALSGSKQTLETRGTIKFDTSIAYGVATIIAHLSAYKVIKTDEDRATDQLKKLAQRSGQPVSNDKLSINSDDDQDTEIADDRIFEWIQSSLKRNNDLMDTVGWLAKSDSKEVKRTTGKVLLNLVERQACRGLVLQSGGGRMLMKIIATLTVSNNSLKQQLPPFASGSETSTMKPDSGQPTLDPSDLHIIQALAKILITTNPLLIFGPSPDSPILLSTIKPLTTLFVHPSSTLLQTFEALMALTNLSSLGGQIPEEVAGSTRVLSRLEECMIGVRTGENHMVRRAATELICNLSTTKLVLQSFGPQSNEPGGSRGSSHISRLHILIALCSSEDLQTALAAGGALAILTEHSKDICQSILTEEKLNTSLSRIFRESIEEEGEGEGALEGEEEKLEDGRIGVQFRLVSLIGNLSTTREANLNFFNPSLIDSLNSLIKKLSSHDKNKSQSDDLIQLTQLVIKSITN